MGQVLSWQSQRFFQSAGEQGSVLPKLGLPVADSICDQAKEAVSECLRSAKRFKFNPAVI